MKKKIIAIALCAALAVGGVVAGSLAFLTDTTDEVVNVFTYGDIDINLAETKGDVVTDSSGNYLYNEFKMIPGATIAKDPKVTVEKGSEACWLFVEITKGNDFDTYMTYDIAEGWTALGDTYPGVYYRAVDAATALAGDAYGVLLNDQVTVKGTVTKDMLENIGEDLPELTFKAYAVQSEGFATAELAWAEAQNPTV